MKKLLKKGFTLLELLIVIVILGLLVSLVSVNFLIDSYINLDLVVTIPRKLSE